jgi:hypothetical protein
MTWRTQQQEAETTLRPIEWNLEMLDAAGIIDQIERGEAPLALLAWTSLMKNSGDEAILRRWRLLAEREPNAIRRADLGMVLVFAQLTKRVEAWRKALEGFNVTESIIVNEWMDQGAVRTAVKALLRILDKKFAPVPAELKAKIEATTVIDALQDWVLIAATVDTLDKFRQDAGL